MAITKGSDWLDRDRRWKAWTKLVRGPQDIDLAKEHGYALTGPFLSFSDALALQPGEYLIVASDTGSVKNHSYDYALVTVGPDGKAENIDEGGAREDALDAALTAGLITEEQRAKAKNSVLYGYALWIYATAAAPPATADPCETPILTGDGSVRCCNCTSVQRKNDRTVLVVLANGGHVKLTSNTPIVATIRPE